MEDRSLPAVLDVEVDLDAVAPSAGAMSDGGELSIVVIDAREIGEPLELLEVRRWQLEVGDEPQGRPPTGGHYRLHLPANG